MKQVGNCAIFGVDLQNCFGHPKGGLYVKDGEEVVGPGNKLIAFGVKNNFRIMFSRDWHPADSKHFDKWPVHGVAGTWDAEFLEGLILPPESHFFFKGTRKYEDGYDPLEGRTAYGKGAGAELILLAQRIRKIYFFGFTTDYCVKTGVITACKLGYEVYVVIDACRAVNVNPGDEQKAIDEMRAAGAIITTTEEAINGKA